MEYLGLTLNSSILRTLCAVGFNKLIKMLRLSSCLLLFLTTCRGQVVPPYGSTAGTFIPPTAPSTFPTAVTPTIPPTVPGVNPFNPRPFLPAGYNNQINPYNNPYRTPNPIAGPAIPILTYSNDHVGDGTYSFSFTTADGKQAQESGYLKDAYIDNAGEPQGTQVVQGSYAYIAPDGTPIQVSYVADENGFRPTGVHIPADGKGLPPPPIIDGKRVVDPFNQYRADPYRTDPYNAANRYNPYNRLAGARPFDPRYQTPFNNRYNPVNPLINPLNNPYRPAPTYGPANNAINGEAPKKV
ncbi:insect cuticle protein domain-containing protein [Phthorimaea operculella]|nr:insect cuticle protein domain-containing protein [Phthorimaea operculella]